MELIADVYSASDFSIVHYFNGLLLHFTRRNFIQEDDCFSNKVVFLHFFLVIDHNTHFLFIRDLKSELFFRPARIFATFLVRTRSLLVLAEHDLNEWAHPAPEFRVARKHSRAKFDIKLA